MPDRPEVILSAFADEGAVTKSAVEELAVCAALGLEYYSVRFVDVGSGVKNIMKLDEGELGRLVELHRQYDIKVASVGSPIGKVKIVDVEDGSHNVYVPFERYLEEDVMHAIALTHRLETRLIRGFSFYPPRGRDAAPYLRQAIDQLGKIAQWCQREGVIYGLEIEANLFGHDGASLRQIHDAVASPAMVLIFDGGNLSSQNKPARQCFEEYCTVREGLGWLHIKDYRIDPNLKWTGFVDEERLKNFVPADQGDSGHDLIFQDLRDRLPALTEKMKRMGAPGVILDLEPHLKGGGQFGGFSGPDGMGVALRALCRVLDQAGIGYRLRGFASLKRPG